MLQKTLLFKEIFMSQINVTRSSMPDFEEYCEEIRELWESRWLTNSGAKHRQLQAELEAYLQVPHVTLFTNGHVALEYILDALDLPKGSEIITTPFTFASTTHAIVRCGFVPVFCDVDPDNYTIDTAKLESLVTDKTSAIIPVHVYGNMCDVDAIAAVAKKHDLKVIYDAAHAFGVKLNGVSAGAFGDASMFSFHATKVFNTVEGGAICFSDDALVSKLDSMKNFGLDGEDCTYAGGNAKMSEFHAAMGVCNLRHLGGEIAKRKIAFERYFERLGGVSGIKLSIPADNVEHNYAYLPVVFDGYRYDRDTTVERLAQDGIAARKYFYPITNSFSCYKDLGVENTTPVAKSISEKILTLPLYADLAIEDVDRICDIILGD